jgi:hypothetical protein
MNKWIIEVQDNTGGWKLFRYADDELAARSTAARAFIKGTKVFGVRIRRNQNDF